MFFGDCNILFKTRFITFQPTDFQPSSDMHKSIFLPSVSLFYIIFRVLVCCNHQKPNSDQNPSKFLPKIPAEIYTVITSQILPNNLSRIYLEMFLGDYFRNSSKEDSFRKDSFRKDSFRYFLKG